LTLRFRSRRARDDRGQALVEFALVLPILVLIMLGVMQFGILFWTQITLTQVARDTGRWTSTQVWNCSTGAVAPTAGTQIAAQANLIAQRSTLFGWASTNQITLASGPTYTEIVGNGICPPDDNQEVWNDSFELRHNVVVFIPFLATNNCVPGCQRALTSEVQFRVEPAP
jgi:hypothetical protein